jgi:protein-S-isoprenylcysteine O-methyltransferase Ste14
MSVALEIMSPIRTRRMSAVSPRRGQSSEAVPIALRVRNFRRTATRMRVSIGVAVLAVMATVVLLVLSTVSSGVRLSASTALIMGFCVLHVIVGAAIHQLVHRNAGSRKTSPDQSPTEQIVDG